MPSGTTRLIASPHLCSCRHQRWWPARPRRAGAKANPGKLDFASSGGGAQLPLMMALFANRTGITCTHIPFCGSSGVQTAIVPTPRELGIQPFSVDSMQIIRKINAGGRQAWRTRRGGAPRRLQTLIAVHQLQDLP